MTPFARFQTILLFCFLTSAPANAQIQFTSDFDNGRFDSVVVRADTLALFPDVPLHVRMRGYASTERQLAIWRGTDYRMRERHRMVFRYENETQWRHCDTGYVQGEWYYFGSTAQFDRDTVYLAYWTPFSYSQMSEYMNRISTHPHVRDAGPRGITAQGRSVFGFAVTDNTVPDAAKAHVVVISRQHCVESPGNFLSVGMADFLMNDNSSEADGLRKQFVFHFYPMASPDLVFHGCDAGKGGFGATNRQWAAGFPDTVLQSDPAFETNVLRRAIMLESGGSVALGFDIHSHPGSIGQWYYWGAKSGSDSASASMLVSAISQRDAALHGGSPLLSPVIAQDLFSTTCDCADHWLHYTAGALAFTLEPGSVPPTGAERTRGAGRAICEGIYAMRDILVHVPLSTPPLPETLQLSNFPNPFRTHTDFEFTLPSGGIVHLVLYDLLGRNTVSVIAGSRYSAGQHVVRLSAGFLAPGFYRAVLTLDAVSHSRLLLRLR